jgi:protein-L-isoaspartate(D-aspartate) O-methyltransferase
MAPTEVVTMRPADFSAQRQMMVDCQVRTFDVTDQALLAALYDVPREFFAARELATLAYADRMLPSAGGKRQILAPMVLARMIQAAALRPTDKVLDVGGGAGYAACVMARLAASVVALENDPALTEAARTATAKSGQGNVSFVTGALDQGHAAGAPYDAILIDGAIEIVPQLLLQQLADGGRLVAVDASTAASRVVRYERTANDFGRRALFNASAPVLDGFRREPVFAF